MPDIAITAEELVLDSRGAIATREVVHERSLRALLLFEIIPASGRIREGVLRWTGTYALLVVRARRHHLARSEIPQAFDGVHATGNHLLVALLIRHICNCHRVLSEHMSLRFCAHVPNAS